MEAPDAKKLEQIPASGRRLPAPGSTSRADTASLQNKVNLARKEIRLGRVDRAQEMLTEVLDNVSTLPWEQFRERHTGKLQIIEGAAASLLGQVLVLRADMTDQAKSALSRAVAVLQEPLEDESSATAQAWTDYGVALDLLGRSDEALTALTKALDLGDTSPETSERLARLMVRAGRWTEAEPILRRTLASGPADIATLCLLGDVQRNLGRPGEAAQTYLHAGADAVFANRLPEALDMFQSAAELLPSDPDTHYAVGEVLRRLDRPKEALAAFDRALELQPTHSNALASKGDVLRVSGDPAGALRAFEAALAVRPNAFALGAKGDVLRSEGDYDGAMRALDEALALEPDAAWVVGTRGQLLRALGRLHEARSELHRATELAPDLAWAWAELAATEYSLAHIDHAVAAATEALEQDPENPLALAVTALCYNEQGGFASAASALEKLTVIIPGTDWTWASLAQARLQLGDDQGALAAADRALELSPQHQDALAVRSTVLLNSGPPERAVEELERYVNAWPDDEQGRRRLAQGWHRLAQARAEKGDHPKALEAYDRALQLPSDDPVLHIGRARSLLATGNVPAAIKEYEEALRRDMEATDLLDELADVANQTHTQDQVVAILQQLRQEHRASEDLLRHQARLEFDLGRYDDVEKTLGGLDAVTETARDNWYRGEAARLRERTQEANRAFKRALEIDPDYLPAMSSLVYLHLDHDRIDRARHYAERALQTHGDDPEVITDLARVDLAEDQFESAQSRIELALLRAPDNRWALVTKAYILTEQGAFQAALPVLERAHKLQPEKMGTLAALGWCRENAAMQRAADETLSSVSVRLSEAVNTVLAAANDAYEHVWRLNPENVFLRRGVADTLDLLERRKEARAHYEAIVQEISASRAYDADTIAVLGWCYYALMEYERAIKTYVSALSSAAQPKEIRYLHFDLALAMLAAGHGEQAVLEYRRGIDRFANDVAPRQRGAFTVARNDLTAARATGRANSADEEAANRAATRAVAMLEEALVRLA